MKEAIKLERYISNAKRKMGFKPLSSRREMLLKIKITIMIGTRNIKTFCMVRLMVYKKDLI
jgi:hypothetical protein